MTIIDKFNERLAAATCRLGFNLAEEEQGSYNWHLARLGVITASNASLLLAKTGSATRDGYISTLIAEICTGAPLDGNQPSGKPIEWGHTHEPSAREMYEFMSGEHVDMFTFVYTDDMRAGCSPDGLIVNKNKGLEIKCPWNSKYHIDALTAGRIKKEYQDQVQFSMWVTGLNEWEFISFDPRMRRGNLFNVTIERSDRYMRMFDDAVPDFVTEMDRRMQVVGFEFGDQWR